MSNRDQHHHDYHQAPKLERLLQAALFRRACPDTMSLSDYQLGLLSVREHARLRAHVARCPHCQAELARLTAFVGERQTALTPMPSGWIADIGFEWQRLVQAGRQTGHVVIRLVKEALTAPPPNPLPVRSRSEEEAEQVYRRIELHPEQTGGLDVQAVVRRSATMQDVWAVQVLAQVPARWPELGGTVVTVTAGGWRREAVTDEAGQVAVEGIPGSLLNLLTIEVDPDAGAEMDSEIDPSLDVDPDSS